MNQLKAYAELLRIPNVFTAMADIALAWLMLYSDDPRTTNVTLLFLLLAASSSFYLGGMALNDFFDAKVDRRERPTRPIPSGRISRRTAGLLGFALLAAGLVFATSTAMAVDDNEPLIIGVCLAVSILAYDSLFKSTPAGPVFMGLCRFLNVLLGTTGNLWYSSLRSGNFFFAPAAVGVYIIGVTLFAKSEAKKASRQNALLMAVSVILLGLTIGMAAPFLPKYLGKPDPEGIAAWYPLLLGIWAVVIAVPVIQAIRKPKAKQVQRAVKTCILGLIGFDAALAFGFAGWPGLWILALLPPALILGRWAYST